MNWYPTIAVAILLTGLALTAHAQDDVAEAVVETILIDGKTLAKTKIRIENKGPDLQPALNALIQEADPDKPDGLPYIRRDGQTHPASQSKDESDRPRIESVGINTETLGLAYYLTGEEKYAKKAAELVIGLLI